MNTENLEEDPSQSEEHQAWSTVRELLDLALPEWRGLAPGAPPAEQAQLAIERLGNAAAELQDLQFHLRNEMKTIRFVLGLDGIPAIAQTELRAHLIRLARLV